MDREGLRRVGLSAAGAVFAVALYAVGVAPDAWHALLLGYVMAHTAK